MGDMNEDRIFIRIFIVLALLSLTLVGAIFYGGCASPEVRAERKAAALAAGASLATCSVSGLGSCMGELAILTGCAIKPDGPRCEAAGSAAKSCLLTAAIGCGVQAASSAFGLLGTVPDEPVVEQWCAERVIDGCSGHMLEPGDLEDCLALGFAGCLP